MADKTKEYSRGDQRTGALVMAIAALFGFLFPPAAKWILLAFALFLIYSAFVEN